MLASSKCDEVLVGRLLDNGANIEARDNGGNTPLFHAAVYGRTTVLKLLLQRGANIEARNVCHTRAHAPIGASYSLCVPRAALHARLRNLTYIDRRTCAPPSLPSCCLSLVQSAGTPPLVGAAIKGLENSAEILINAGANVTARTSPPGNGLSTTAREWARYQGHTGVVALLDVAIEKAIAREEEGGEQEEKEESPKDEV